MIKYKGFEIYAVNTYGKWYTVILGENFTYSGTKSFDNRETVFLNGKDIIDNGE